MKFSEKLEHEVNEKYFKNILNEINKTDDNEKKEKLLNRISLSQFMYSVERKSIIDVAFELGMIAHELGLSLPRKESETNA